MGKIISIANQKGGVGKTTTAVNISAILAKKGKKVLLIDTDPQGNATSGLGIEKNFEFSIYDVIIGDTKITEAIQNTQIKNLKICPSNINLAGAEVELVSMISREYRLKEKLEECQNDYDYIIIDCPPSLGLLTTNALVSSNSVIIPVQCEFFALEGITQLLNTIIMTQTRLNPGLKIEGVLLTLLDSRTVLGLEVVEEVRKFFKEKVFNTIIPRLIRLVEAPSHGEPIIEYDPLSRAAEAYLNLAKEVILRDGE